MEKRMHSERARELLHRFFGYETFRPMQESVISTVMNGRDTLVLMPTGGGKSICFQIPALLSAEGVTIVVSPLIALMKDQVEALQANGIPAASVNSAQTDAANRTVMEAVYRGRIKLLYISPERLVTEIERWSEDIRVALIAVDEAHCISQWGHDFRPEYTRLGELKERWPDVPMMALTATADRTTREDIIRQLGLRSPEVFISSFDRPNLSLKVVSGAKKSERVRIIRDIAHRYPGDSGIVYCMSRKSAEDMAETLGKIGIRAGCYHAGMSAADRNKVQTAFINDDINVVCATIAFGMGIDKSNIRWVVHNNLPGSIENYYQEIGRAGRDGLPAETVLFYGLQDVILRERMIQESGQRALNAEKLRVMRNYAEATICRRRILLNYFNEEIDHDCGNCDVCLSPPERFDATIEAQMALSAIVRTDGRAGISMIIDILRGSARADLVSKGFNRLKTFGVGRSHSVKEWNQYLTQMYQLGLYEVDWANDKRILVTPYGKKVLFNGERVMLTVVRDAATNTNFENRKTEVNYRDSDLSERIFTELKKLRRVIAKAQGVPPYLIFSDKHLLEIARRAPRNYNEFASCEGVGEVKARKYWHPMVNEVRKLNGEPTLPQVTDIHERLIAALMSGVSAEDIGHEFGMSGRGVYEIVADMIRKDEFRDYDAVCSRKSFARIMVLNRSLSEVKFRTEVRREFPDGLEIVAMAIASALLRNR